MKFNVVLIIVLISSYSFAQCPETENVLDRKINGDIVADEFGIVGTGDEQINIDGFNIEPIWYTIPQGQTCGGESFWYVSFDTDGNDDTADPFPYNFDSETWHEVIVNEYGNTWKYWVRPPSGYEVGQPDFLLNPDGSVLDKTFSSVPNQDLVRYPNNPKRLGYSIGTYGGTGSAVRTAYTADCYCNEMGYTNGASSYQASSTSGTVMYKESGSNWSITGSPSIHVITQITCSGSQVYKKNIDNSESITQNYLLEQNYPNPFNPTTEISFYIHKNSFVTLKVYDVLGKEISTLANGIFSEGSHSIAFDAAELPSGVYFYTITAGNFAETKKMILTK